MRRLENKSSITKNLKNIVLDLGAVTVGCTNLEDNFIYSHNGRLDENYGNK